MTVVTLFDGQVAALVGAVRRLNASNGADAEAYTAVRRQVTGELVNRGSLDMVSAAMGILGETASGRLKDVVSHCSEKFYFEDRVLCAIVVPVAIRLVSRVGGQIEIDKARPLDLSTTAKLLERRSGAKKVVFDTRLYDAKTLFHTKPKNLSTFLSQLADGEVLPEGGPRSITVRSAPEPQWQMVYFLGVQVTEPDAPLMMNEEGLQRAMAQWRCHIEWAITEHPAVMMNKSVTANARGHGYWYLREGVRRGENLVRKQKLKDLISNFDQGVDGVYFNYTHDLIGFQVKLLLSSHLMTVEFRWKLFADESVDDFRAALDEVIDLLIPANEVIEKREIDMFDYDALAQKRGLVWES